MNPYILLCACIFASSVLAQDGNIDMDTYGNDTDEGSGNYGDEDVIYEWSNPFIINGYPGKIQPNMSDECCGKIGLFRVQNRVVHILP